MAATHGTLNGYNMLACRKGDPCPAKPQCWEARRDSRLPKVEKAPAAAVKPEQAKPEYVPGPLRLAVEEEWSALADDIEFKLMIGAMRVLADDLDARGFKAAGPSASAGKLRDLLYELRDKRDAKAKVGDELDQFLSGFTLRSVSA